MECAKMERVSAKRDFWENIAKKLVVLIIVAIKAHV